MISLTTSTLLHLLSSIVLHLIYYVYVTVPSVSAGKPNLCVKRDQMISQSCWSSFDVVKV
jgi:hypothetical protein